MKKIALTTTALAVALGGFHAAHGGLIEDWQFESAPDGTDINNGAVVNSAGTATWQNNAWVSDVYSSQGDLLVGGRIGPDATWAEATTSITTGKVWQGFYGVTWQLAGGTAGEFIEFGVSDSAANTIAGVRLERTASSTVTLSGISDSGDDVATSVNLATSNVGGTAVSDDVYDFVIEFDFDAEVYTIFYKTTTESDFTVLGSGTAAADHHYETTAIRVDGNAQSLGINDGSSGLPTQEHFTFDRIVVSDENLIPEPASAVLLAVGGLAMLGRRRKP